MVKFELDLTEERGGGIRRQMGPFLDFEIYIRDGRGSGFSDFKPNRN